MPATAFVFDSDQLDAALSRWPEGAPDDQARLFRAAVRDFLQSDAARKLRVIPSPPSTSPGLRPQPAPQPDPEDARDG